MASYQCWCQRKTARDEFFLPRPRAWMKKFSSQPNLFFHCEPDTAWWFHIWNPFFPISKVPVAKNQSDSAWSKAHCHCWRQGKEKTLPQSDLHWFHMPPPCWCCPRLQFPNCSCQRLWFWHPIFPEKNKDPEPCSSKKPNEFRFCLWFEPQLAANFPSPCRQFHKARYFCQKVVFQHWPQNRQLALWFSHQDFPKQTNAVWWCDCQVDIRQLAESHSFWVVQPRPQST